MSPPRLDGTEIGVIGLAGRFPGAGDVETLWQNLRHGVESIRRLEAVELAAAGVSAAAAADPDFVPVAADLAGIELFDAAFFGIGHREAEILDPQQRLLLECAWQALEDAGHDPAAFDGRIGVFASATTSSYLLYNLAPHPTLGSVVDPLQLLVANAADSLATRIAYKLDLRGPAVTVQSACSSSLVAVHLACRSLLDEECDLALVGGVSINVRARAGYRYTPGSILSPDGHCRPFDAGAAGTVFGSGVGVAVLRRAGDALAAGDHLRALIRGSAVNNDGALKVGYTAPSVEGQAEVVAEALAASGVDADSIGYIEAHGTGTTLGDPIEVQALAKAFHTATERRGFCAIGSLKANIGHLDVAAGIAGLIKTVLVLEREEIPPSLHFARANPKIDFAASPVHVNDRLRPWPRGAQPRRAAVSSFGFGGTNAHVILEEAPEQAPRPTAEQPELLLLSARSAAALAAAGQHLADHLAAWPELDLRDVAHTLQRGRRTFAHRRALVASTTAEAAALLADATSPRSAYHVDSQDPRARPVVFLLPGQGAQYPGMGRRLYDSQPVFRAVVDRCLPIFAQGLGLDLGRLLFPRPDDDPHATAARLAGTDAAQAALFTIELATAELWRSWGVKPAALLGHSLGELAAACLAGVFSLEEGATLVAARGRLMAAQPPGAMLAVSLPEAEAASLVRGELALAAVNEPGRTVLSGPAEAIAALAAELAGHGVVAQRLHTSHAFHSAMMEGVLAPFAEEVRRLTPRPPRLPWVSSSTGTWIDAAQATSPEYWARQLRAPVRFADAVATLAGPGGRLTGEPLWLEVGPGRTLSGLVRRHPAARGATVASLPHPQQDQDDRVHLLEALGRLWLEGLPIDWPAASGGARRRLSLPTYPFERRRYWIDAAAPAATAEPTPGGTATANSGPAGAAPAPAAPLPALHERPALATPFVAPQGELERTLAEIWGRVLGVGAVGRHDNFFELGGDSFIAVEAIQHLRRAIGREVPVISLYEGLTVASLARLLGEETPAARAQADEHRRELEAGRDRRKALQARLRGRQPLVGEESS